MNNNLNNNNNKDPENNNNNKDNKDENTQQERKPSTDLQTVVTLELALERAGFGLYSYLLILLTGLVIVSFACVVYSNTVLVPISACELKTTTGQQGILAAMPSIGAILGALFWGYLADTRGRRFMLLLSLLLGAIFNAISSLSVDWIMLLVIQFIASILVAGQFPIAMTLLSESVPLERRNLVVILVTSIFLFAQGIMAAIAIPISPIGFSHPLPGLGINWTPWRAISLLYSVPSLISFGWMFYMQESPKFAFKKGEEFRAIQILSVIHRINHRKTGEPLDVTGLLGRVSKPNLNPITSSRDKIKPLFRKPLLRNLILITTLYLFQVVWPFKVWLPTISNRFVSILETGKGSQQTLCQIIVLSLQETSQDKSCRMNVTALTLVIVVCAVQSVANIMLSPFVNRVGRRHMVMAITFVCGFSGILVNLVPNAYASGTLFTIQLIGMICMGYYTAIAVSLFPTQVRAMGVTIAVTGGRISTFVTIQILNYLLKNYCEVGFFVFSTLFASSSLVASLLPQDSAINMLRRLSIMRERNIPGPLVH